ncbi:MAG TPA: hypothetical protein VEJ18_03590 [Planctomycetota bacterium]|nr:hypothetical protein [Planctomycetota bacterium]
MSDERWGVRCDDGSWCLMWGDDSPKWYGTRENAEDRAAKLTATSCTRSVYRAVRLDDEGEARHG